jgi:hypothetical protein
MGWYKNQKARHEAHKAGLPRPLTGATVAIQEAADAKKARKRERKLARRGTAGPS